MEKEANYGRAYAFFDCRYPKEEIKETLQIKRDKAQSGLELTLTENPEKIRDNQELAEALEVTKRIDLSKLPADQREEASKTISYRYVLETKYQDTSNEDAATDLVRIMNKAYMSTHLWEYGEDLFGRIIYKKGNNYVVAER